MKAYLLIADEKEAANEKRFNCLLEKYVKVAKEYEVKASIFHYVVNRLKKAFKKCLEGDFDYEMGKSNYPLANDEILYLAQKVFSVEDLAILQMKEYPSYSHFTEYNEEALIRNGIIYELKKEYYEAWKCYYACDSKMAFNRSYKIKKLLDKENHKNYIKGMRLYKLNDYDNAYYPLMSAADNGDIKSSLVIGEMIIKGLGCKPCIEEGMDYLNKAFLFSSSRKDAAKVIMRLYKEGYLIGYIDYEKLVFVNEQVSKKTIEDVDYLNILKEKADQGNVYCMLRLGKESKNTDEQKEYYKKASESGNAEASYNLSKLFIEENEHYLDLAAKQGSIQACHELMNKYKDNIEMKGEYAYIAANLGDGLGAYEYAKILEKNGDNPIDYYVIAGEKGIIEALLRLARAYKFGELGLEINESKANEYIFKSGMGRD